MVTCFLICKKFFFAKIPKKSPQKCHFCDFLPQNRNSCYKFEVNMVGFFGHSCYSFYFGSVCIIHIFWMIGSSSYPLHQCQLHTFEQFDEFCQISFRSWQFHLGYLKSAQCFYQKILEDSARFCNVQIISVILL